MAIWQYTFFVFPNESLINNENNYSLFMTEDGFDSEPFWRIHQYTLKDFEPIGLILPLGKSWCKDLTVYGNLDSNCFTVMCSDGIVISASFRINYTIDYESILNQIIEFCILNGFVLMDQEQNIVKMNTLTINQIIFNSPQLKMLNKLSQKPE